jgi:hypothetical protein
LIRVRNSAAYRSAGLYRRLLRLLPSPPARPKPPLPLTLLTFGGAGHRVMIEQLLASVYIAWPRLPRVRVISDGSLPVAAMARALSWWPGACEVALWTDCVTALPAADREHIVRFAEREPMGRKLAAVVATAAAGPTLYCDADVLWFRFPPTLDQLLAAPAPAMVMSEDPYPAYDPALVPDRLPHLAVPPYSCAGLLYAAGDFLGAGGAEDFLADAAEHGVGITEQTILAEINYRLGGRHWPVSEIALMENDRFSLGPSFRGRGWAARHYVGQVRHLFWRDALALRAGIAPGPVPAEGAPFWETRQ